MSGNREAWIAEFNDWGAAGILGVFEAEESAVAYVKTEQNAREIESDVKGIRMLRDIDGVRIWVQKYEVLP